MAEIYRVRTVFTGVAGTPWYSNQYFNAVGFTAVDALAAVDTFWTTFTTAICTPVTWTVEGVVPTIETTTGDIVSQDTFADQTGAGTNGTSMMPPANQILVNLRTGNFLGGREIRGKIYIPATSAAGGTDAGAPQTSILDFTQAAADVLVDDVDSQLVVFSRTNGVAFAVEQANVSGKYAVLRSRRD